MSQLTQQNFQLSFENDRLQKHLIELRRLLCKSQQAHHEVDQRCSELQLALSQAKKDFDTLKETFEIELKQLNEQLAEKETLIKLAKQ